MRPLKALAISGLTVALTGTWVRRRLYVRNILDEAAHRSFLLREAERARNEATAASRTKDEFLAMLGHELRNPLAPIVTTLELMAMRDDTAHRQERLILERQVQHLVGLVDDLLDISRITRGQITLQKEPVALDTAVAQAIDMTAPLVEERDQRLDVRVPQGLIVDGDRGRLAQIFANLINNAAKYSQKGAVITIVAEREKGDIVCRVIDTGMGIPRDMLPRIFDQFVQQEQGLDRAQGGLGLGLTIVESLVRLHGGEVSAHSAGPGRGSEFRVRLPASSGREAPIAKRARTERTGAAPPGTRVLVVDDNIEAAGILVDALSELGYDAAPANDGPEALSLAEYMKPAVAFVDIGLPGMNGYELAEAIRARPELAGIQLIALTGYGQSRDRARAKQAGFRAHLVKPVTLERLQSAIGEVLGS